MKPIHTLTWAVSAPILLFAGASHAINVSDLVDSACAGTFKFDSGANKIWCDTTAAVLPVCSVSAPATAVVGSTATVSASCTQGPITEYAWTGTPTVSGASTSVNFTTAGSYTYTVAATNAAGLGSTSAPKTITVTAAGGGGSVGGACPSGYVVPTGTKIINIGTIDYYANKDFHNVFDSPGSTFTSLVGSTEIKALKFTNNKFAAGFISGLQGTVGGTGYKDWSLSVCPGDFNTNLGTACLKINKSTTNINYRTDGNDIGCLIPANTPVYLNIKSTKTGTSSGFLLQNVKKSDLQ